MLAEIAVRMDGIILNQRITQSVPCKYVNPHGSKIALRAFRLFLKFVNLIAVLGIHNAEAVCFLHRHLHNGNRCRCIVRLMEGKHLGIIHFINVVTGKNQHIFRIIAVDKVNILINGVCRPVEPFAGIPCFHMRCKNRHTAVFLIQIPWNPNPDMLIQTQRLILCQHADGIHTGVNAVAQRKIDDTISPTVCNGRLCHLSCQHAQTTALSTRQKHCYHFFFTHITHPYLFRLYICNKVIGSVLIIIA